MAGCSGMLGTVTNHDFSLQCDVMSCFKWTHWTGYTESLCWTNTLCVCCGSCFLVQLVSQEMTWKLCILVVHSHSWCITDDVVLICVVGNSSQSPGKKYTLILTPNPSTPFKRDGLWTHTHHSHTHTHTHIPHTHTHHHLAHLGHSQVRPKVLPSW